MKRALKEILFLLLPNVYCASLEKRLNIAKRVLEDLETRAAAYGFLHLPAHRNIELTDQRQHVQQLEASIEDARSQQRNTTITRQKKKKLFRQILAWFILGFLILGVVIPIIVGLQNNTVVILVADFDGVSTQTDKITETIINNLKNATGKYSDVQVKSLNKVITGKEGSDIAREQGKAQNATVVIWGWYTKKKKTVPISVNFEILKKPESYISFEWDKATKGEIRKFNPDALETFQVQTILSKNMAYLTLTLLGMSRYSAQDYNGAIDRFTAALTQVDNSSDLTGYPQEYIPLFYRGISYLMKENSEQSISDMNKVIKLVPFDATAYWARGFMNSINKSCDSAISDFNRSIEISPKASLFYSTRGSVFATQEKYQEALDDFTTYIKLKPNDPEGYHHRAMIYRRQEKYNEAIDDFTRVIQMSSNDIDDRFYAYFGRALSYSSKKEDRKAASDYSEAIKLKPRLAEAYINRGNFYLNKKEYNQALIDFNESINVEPSNSSAYYYRSVFYSTNKKYDLAIEDLSKVIQLELMNQGNKKKTVWGFSCENDINPNLSSMTYYNRGLVYINKKDLDSALSDFDRSIKSSSDNVDAYISRAYIYVQNKDYTRAMNDLNAVTRIKPDNVDAYISRAYIYVENKDYAQAIDQFNYALRIREGDAHYYNARGVMYGRKGDYNQALSDLNIAIRLNPNSADIHDSIGTIYRYMKNNDLAIKYYNQAIQFYEKTTEIEANTAESYFWRGTIYQKQGKLSNAIIDFQKAVKIPDNSVFNQKAREKLQEILKQK